MLKEGHLESMPISWWLEGKGGVCRGVSTTNGPLGQQPGPQQLPTLNSAPLHSVVSSKPQAPSWGLWLPCVGCGAGEDAAPTRSLLLYTGVFPHPASAKQSLHGALPAPTHL